MKKRHLALPVALLALKLLTGCEQPTDDTQVTPPPAPEPVGTRFGGCEAGDCQDKTYRRLSDVTIYAFDRCQQLRCLDVNEHKQAVTDAIYHTLWNSFWDREDAVYHKSASELVGYCNFECAFTDYDGTPQRGYPCFSEQDKLVAMMAGYNVAESFHNDNDEQSIGD